MRGINTGFRRTPLSSEPKSKPRIIQLPDWDRKVADKEVQWGAEVEKYCMSKMGRVGEGAEEEGGATDNKGIHTWCQPARGTILTSQTGPSFVLVKAVLVFQSSLLLFNFSSMNESQF